MCEGVCGACVFVCVRGLARACMVAGVRVRVC